MVDWQRNLWMIWLSQFLAMIGFSFALPFAPYYIQELGITDSRQLNFHVAMFSATAHLSLAVFSPIWGAVADRFGRRIMLLRATFGGAVVLALMGSVQSVQALLILRLVQGSLTGTVTAAQTLVSVYTPMTHSGFALGTLSTAVFSGTMIGTFVGGAFAELFGYRIAFHAASMFLLAGGLLIVFGVREEFVRPPRGLSGAAPARRRFTLRMPALGPALPILLLIMAMAFVRQFDAAWLPLLVQDIHGAKAGAAMRTGLLGALGGIAGMLSGVILGRLADRCPPPRIAMFSALGAALFMVPQGLAQGFVLLFAARFGMVFWAGGLDPVFQIWLTRVTPPHRRGSVFGWAATAKAVGWAFAPLISGALASGFGIRSIYFAGALLFLMLIPLIARVVGWIERSAPVVDESA